ncbi:hypothetical protein F6P94_02765 [Escherichia coli]|nr:hypothetical protein F6P94_02765 [Escherichia coli]
MRAKPDKARSATGVVKPSSRDKDIFIAHLLLESALVELMERMNLFAPVEERKEGAFCSFLSQLGDPH